MPYPVIPSNLKNIQSVYLKMMSPSEMTEMSYGEVLTGETINYRTGVPQTNGLFCQAIFGPTKDWECQCGKYKRYRYAGVICDKCGVEVTHSAVRRERMGHISLAAPCVHPWFLRIIPSRVALLLEMKSADISRVCYFSAYIIISINEEMRAEYITRIDQESDARIKAARSSYDKKFEEMSREYQISKSSGKFQADDLKVKYESDKDILKTQQAELITKIETIAEMARKELIGLKVKDVINENIHQELAQKFGPVFKAEIGAEAVETLLKDIDLEKEFETLKARIDTTKGQAKKKLAKKIKLVKHFLNNETSPAWMILHRVMVLPPDLRPMLQLDGGRFAASDLNDLYRRLINRNNRLRKLIQIGAPEVILRNEKRMLQEAVEALIDNSARNGKQVMASTGIKRPLKSLTDSIKGKGGRFRQNLLGKRVDYSGRSVIIGGPTLKLHQCGLPKEMALELFKPFLIGRIISKSERGVLTEEDQCFNIHSARRLIETKKSIIYDILDEIITDKYVLLNRAPTLHRLGFLAFKPVLIEGKAIQLHPLVCRGFNADFDGDSMAVHLPITIKGQEEARDLMASNKNLLKPANGRLITGGSQDIVLGAYYLTYALPVPTDSRIPAFASSQEAMIAYNNKHIKTQELIKLMITQGNKTSIIETTAGRIIFDACFPAEYEFVNRVIDKKEYEKLLDKIFQTFGQDRLALILDKIKDTTFNYATYSGISISCGDLLPSSEKQPLILDAQSKVAVIQSFYGLGMLSEKDKHRQIISLWRQTSEEVFKLSKAQIFPTSNIGMMVNSSARGNDAQINFMIGMRGITVATNGDEVELPAIHGYLEGLSPLEYFVSMKGHRKGMAGTALQTADAGYLTRRLVDVAQNIVIMSDDCGTQEGLIITKANSATLKKTVLERIYGRCLNQDIVIDNEVIIAKGEIVDHQAIDKLEAFEDKLDSVLIRTVTKCDLSRGVCRKCYGTDLSTHKSVEMGTAVGIIGAQSLGEPSTQLAVGSSKHGVAIGAKSDITEGLPRVEELFEARIPKFVAPMSTVNGTVTSVEGNLEQGFKVTIQSNQNQISFEIDDSQRHLLVKENASIDVGDPIVSSATGEVIHSTLAGKAITNGNQLMIVAETARVEELMTSPGIYLSVMQGQTVNCGQPVTEGALDLQTLLDLNGIDAVQHYIVQQLNEVYTNNGIDVDEKHIEVIIRQMCSRAQIIDSGETDLLIGDTVRIAVIKTANKKALATGKKPAVFKRAISGISRSSLATDSFLSAASFQETARVLVEAALSCRKDPLLGLKENVILGQLIPSGTGFDYSRVLTNADVHDEFDEVEAVFAEE